MPKPVADWNEDDILGLPAGENDTFERKGSMLLDLTLPGVREDNVLDELAKQLSAFANAGGGRIIYGVANNGTIDNGGVARSVKGRQSTKEWLEDVIPRLTEFEVIGFNVYEIKPERQGSQIDAAKSVFIVDVPDSERAPHQSKRDLKYYLRLAGKSHPIPHRLIEDIRNRQKYPEIDVTKISVDTVWLPPFDPNVAKFEGQLQMRVRVELKNVGRLMTQNTCLGMNGPHSFNWTNYDDSTIQPRGNRRFWELQGPLYPGMEIGFWMDAVVSAKVPPQQVNLPFGGTWLIAGNEIDHVELSWKVYADNAPVRVGNSTLDQLGFEHAARRALDQHPHRTLIRQIFQQL